MLEHSAGSLEADLIPIALLVQHADKRMSLKDRTWEKQYTKYTSNF